MGIKILIKMLEFMPERVTKKIASRFVRGILHKYANVSVEGYENIKDVKGPILFICNHLSNADGLILNEVLKKEDVTFVAGVKLGDNSFTNLGVITVKTTPIVPNSADNDGLKKIIKILKKGENVLVFPEGTRSRCGSMIAGKKGVVMMQKLSKALIVPIGLSGTEKLLPINDKDMGKEKFHHAAVRVKIGEPIQMLEKEPDETKEEYEERKLQHFMISIARLLPEKYRGVYASSI